MKTRITHTKIHFEDDWFNSLELWQKYLFMYLFTNTHIGLTGVYKLSKRMALLETGATEKEWDEACQIFQNAGKIKFTRNWVYVINSSKYSNYAGEKNKLAFKKELNLIPKAILKEFGYPMDTVSIPYAYPMDTSINHKSEIINHKSEIINKGIGYQRYKETAAKFKTKRMN